MFRISSVASLVAVLGALLSTPAQALISRTYVASYGNDANSVSSCNFGAPCRTFQTALNSTLAGGEILAIDGSGYGPLTIDRSVSIIANPGVFAGIGVFSGAGVTIATAGVTVVLRGLTFNAQGGTWGVYMSDGARLSVENCVFANFPSGGTAIMVLTAASVHVINTLVRDSFNGVLIGGAAANISGSQFLGNSNVGVYVISGSATVNASVVTGNGASSIGIYVPGGSATVSASAVTGSAWGLYNSGGTIRSLGNNNVTGNTTSNTQGAITATPLM